MIRTFPAQLAALLLICLPGSPSAHAASPAQTLAMPGFFASPRATGGFLGFASALYLREPGIWGVLCLTTEQGELLAKAFAETWTLRFDDPGMDAKTAKELEVTFRKLRDEILTEDQRQTVRSVNQLFVEFAKDHSDAKSADLEAFWELLKPTLSAEQWENFNAMRGQKP